LYAATQPLGVLKVPTGQGVRGQSVALSRTSLWAGEPHGDAFQRAFASRPLMTLDAGGAPFLRPMAGLAEALHAHTASARAYDALVAPRLAWHYHQPNGVRLSLSAPSSNGEGDDASASSAAYLASVPLPDGRGRMVSGYGVHAALGFAPSASRNMLPHMTELFLPAWPGFARGMHVGAETKTWQILGFQDDDAYAHVADHPDAARASLAGFMAGVRTPWSLGRAQGGTNWQVGFVRENGARQSSLGHGALRLAGAHDTWFFGASSSLALAGGWHGMASGYVGITDASASGEESLVRDLGRMVSSQFALALVRPHLWRTHDQLSLYLAQPLRVESGRAALLLPTRRTPAGQIVQERYEFDLAPSGRSVEWGLQYRQHAFAGELALGAALVHEPGHRRDAEPEARLLLSWQYRF
ncbi:MAG: hypothetical protein OXB87_03530, partial [Hyphomicrobiales bacterium]|nr:hypothetical protein [Hyphomicrobiales bacterium]